MLDTRSKHAPESAESLWVLVIAPAIWAAHLLLSYLTAAVWCEKFAGGSQSLAPVRVAIGVFTMIAVAGIAATGFWAFRRSSDVRDPPPGDFDHAGDRRRFIGFATLLLSCLSLVATLFVAAVVIFVETCH